MSNCSICGTVEYWHAAEEGAEFTAYCPQCNPPKTVVLPLDVGKDWDIDESEIHGMPAPVVGVTSSTGPWRPGPMPGLNLDDEAMPGVPSVADVDDLPKNASEGNMVYVRWEKTAYVFDGTEWQNLGANLRKTVGKDAKCDRRAAIKATKAKNAE